MDQSACDQQRHFANVFAELDATLEGAFRHANFLASKAEVVELAEFTRALVPLLLTADRMSVRKRWIGLLLDLAMPEEASLLLDSYPETPESCFLRARLDTYGSSEGFEIPVYVLSLPKDHLRWKRTSGALRRAGYQNVIKLEAINARGFSRNLLSRIVPNNDLLNSIGIGAVGCWLSHETAWERISEGESDLALVLEDDATPFVHSSFLRAFIAERRDCRFLWVNERMSALPGQVCITWNNAVSDPWHRLSNWTTHRTSIGTDAYLVSKATAGILFDSARENSIVGHVDGQLAAWTMSPCSEPVHPLQNMILRFQNSMEMKDEIQSACLDIPAFKELDFGISTRRQE